MIQTHYMHASYFITAVGDWQGQTRIPPIRATPMLQSIRCGTSEVLNDPVGYSQSSYPD